MTRTVADILATLPAPEMEPLPKPAFTPSWATAYSRVALAVPSMEHHMSNEGWQIMLGLQEAGYRLCGHGLNEQGTNTPAILDAYYPGTVLVQDIREWDQFNNGLARPHERFTEFECLKDRSDLFKLTILKDAHQRPLYHRNFCESINCHAWVVYYHPAIVARLAPYVRPEHLVRTYHTIDVAKVPAYTAHNRNGCLLSGAFERRVYPLRWSLMVEKARNNIDIAVLPHPGYHSQGTRTNSYLEVLATFKVAICTSSIYGYALRKIVEATACGCRVITDLPVDEVLPEIDANLIRLQANEPFAQVAEISQLLPDLYAHYDAPYQEWLALRAKQFYSHYNVCQQLANDIETLGNSYCSSLSAGTEAC